MFQSIMINKNHSESTAYRSAFRQLPRRFRAEGICSGLLSRPHSRFFRLHASHLFSFTCAFVFVHLCLCFCSLVPLFLFTCDFVSVRLYLCSCSLVPLFCFTFAFVFLHFCLCFPSLLSLFSFSVVNDKVKISGVMLFPFISVQRKLASNTAQRVSRKIKNKYSA